MDALQDIIERARRFPPEDRRQIIEALGRRPPDDIEEGEPSESPQSETAEQRERRQAAMKRWLANAGTTHPDFTDVAGNKHTHLAEIYAD